MERVGIRERHLVDKGVAASDLAVAAVKNLVASHPFDLQKVDLIVVGTVTPDMMYPSTACLVQHKLGIENTWGFDVSAGCSGFLYALNTGVKFVESGQYKKVLVIGRRKFVDDRLHGSRRVHHFSATERGAFYSSRRKTQRSRPRSCGADRGHRRTVSVHARRGKSESGHA